MIREVSPVDVQQICDIYNHYVKNTFISFEEAPVSCDDMGKRIANITASLPFYVYIKNNNLIGFAYANKWKDRFAYRFSVESSIYLKHDLPGNGFGAKLYKPLLDDLRSKNFHSVIGGIALPNEQSRMFHEKLGFKKVAHFSEVGFKFDRWIDVGYWELLF